MRMRRLLPLTAALAVLLAACDSANVIPEGEYSRAALAKMEPLGSWSLEGRLALSGAKDSWSANLLWQHDKSSDQLKLSGPLGQGGAIIRLDGTTVSIDRGGGNVQTSTQPEAFINQQLGMSVPLSALRYWVVGLPEPDRAFVDITTGFRQAGWLVEYKQMQVVNKRLLPRKMTVTGTDVKLKLVIEQWDLHEADRP